MTIPETVKIGGITEDALVGFWLANSQKLNSVQMHHARTREAKGRILQTSHPSN